jgi:(E)-4-hydroxy-3-methylbut-2-enyl-diphosphate synthase
MLTNRIATKSVKIGHIGLGSNYPIRIQSMTNTDTMDTMGSVEQILKIADAGADFVRLTTPGIKDVNNLIEIKKELERLKRNIPLVADIHFNPEVAEQAARIVEKIRINPGNYFDRNQKNTTWNNTLYNIELEKIHSKIVPLITICKQYGTAVRIGTNHGSLSQRIVDRYGDTPTGMVESALEFVDIFTSEGFDQIVLSMKSSNTIVMVEAYRLLAKKLIERNCVFPLHLGVTEAGNQLEGRLKSAAGIGTLLTEGIGDTIRVSLSEPPENEIPVAKEIIAISEKKRVDTNDFIQIEHLEFVRRDSKEIASIGGRKPPIVIGNRSKKEEEPDLIYSENVCSNISKPIILPYSKWLTMSDKTQAYPLLNYSELETYSLFSSTANFVILQNSSIHIDHLKTKSVNHPLVLLVPSNNYSEAQKIITLIEHHQLNLPIINLLEYSSSNTNNIALEATIDASKFLFKGISDGLWIKTIPENHGNEINALTYKILQACRQRFTKTEFIICPTCGRTQFDIEKVSESIKQKTSNFKNLKIAIMGCIVNGPGEMADADYGYVGAGKEKVNLYKGKFLVKKNIHQDEALKELLLIIEADNIG